MRRPRQRGFTLIELLVGLTLLGLVVVAVTGSLRIGISGTDRVTERAARTDDLRAVHGFLREHLEAARPLRWREQGGSRLAFAGEAERLSFVADMPAYPGVGGLYKLTLLRQNAEIVLSRELTEGRSPGFDLARGERHVVLRDVRSFNLAYYGAVPGEREPRWHDVWNDGNAFPELIRIRIARSGSVPPWPDIVISPRLGEQPR